MARIRDLPSQERPREKAIRFGISSLSSAELLAIIIGAGYKEKSALDISNELISKYNGISNLLSVSQQNLMTTKGISIATSLKIAACFELANKILNGLDLTESSIKQTYEFLLAKYQLKLQNKAQEELHLICIGNKGKILKEKLMYIGTEALAEVSLTELLKESLISGCKKIILIHNHPNGSNRPSDEDLVLTSDFKDELKRFHLNLFDHIIITCNGYFSMCGRME